MTMDPRPSARWIIGLILCLGVMTGGVPFAQGGEAPDPGQAAVGQTPPRLSLVDGQVSFWRPGAQDWTQAQVNTPLAPADQLYTGSPGTLELQVGARAFVRGWATTQLGLESQEPDFLQFRVTVGRVSFDLRTLESGRTVEVDTPNAAITIEHPGYYRVSVSGEHTSFITRRSGRATVIPANGEAILVAPSEEVVLEGAASPQVASYAAPQLDEWDRWNYARTDALLDAVSARYVSPGAYGVDDLDQYGTWRVVPTYGSVWVPTGVPAGWVPYSTGSWILDPYYGWTWVDTAPWGWAPFHYGRWVMVNGYWAWAPGPVIARPVYAPALVAFLGEPGVRVGVGVTGPLVGWVALGWGEPCVPWWGRPGLIHTPWWGGWGGPRVVNNVVIDRTTVVNVQNITVYHNTNVRNAVVVVNENRFGHGPITSARLAGVDAHNLHPIHAAPSVAAAPASFVPTANRGTRPPEESLRRPVVATRPPQHGVEPGSGREREHAPSGVPIPPPKIVSLPRQGEPSSALPRAPFGQSTVERPMANRPQQPPAPPKAESSRRAGQGPEGAPPGSRGVEQKSRREAQGVNKQPPTSPQSAPREATLPANRPEARRPQDDHAKPPALPQAPPPVKREIPQQPRPEAHAPVPAAPPPVAPRPQVDHTKPPVLPQAPPPVKGEVTPQPRPEARATSRVPPGPPATARRQEAPKPPPRSLPGEPASRLAPNRAEARPSGHVEHKEAPAPGRPEGGPGASSHDRNGK